MSALYLEKRMLAIHSIVEAAQELQSLDDTRLSNSRELSRISGDESHYEISENDFRCAVRELQALKDSEGKLSASLRKLGDSIKARRAEILPASRHYGLASLPNEVLDSIIKEMLYSKDVRHCFANAESIVHSLTRVSRFFHNLVVGCSDVWSYISLDRPGHNQSTVKLWLDRSKQNPLSLKIVYCEDQMESFNQVLLERRRLIYLSLSIGPESLLCEEHKGLEFCSVRNLDAEVDIDASSLNTVFHHWAFPNVQEALLYGDLPDNSNFFGRNRLVTFSYTPSSDTLEQSHALQRLGNLLLPGISLQDLTLSFEYLRHWGDDPFTASEIELPCVSKFSISNTRVPDFSHYDDEDPPMSLVEFSQIISRFRLPKLQDLSLSVAFIEEEDFQPEGWLAGWLGQAFPQRDELRSITKLTFNVMWFRFDWIIPCRVLDLNDLFEHFPSVEALMLDTPLCKIQLMEGTPENSIANLHFLHLKNFDGVFQDITELLTELEYSAVDLREVTIDLKQVIDQAELEDHCQDATVKVRRISPQDDN